MLLCNYFKKKKKNFAYYRVFFFGYDGGKNIMSKNLRSLFFKGKYQYFPYVFPFKTLV